MSYGLKSLVLECNALDYRKSKESSFDASEHLISQMCNALDYRKSKESSFDASEHLISQIWRTIKLTIQLIFETRVFRSGRRTMKIITLLVVRRTK